MPGLRAASAFAFAVWLGATAAAAAELRVLPKVLQQGQPALVELRSARSLFRPALFFRGRRAPLVAAGPGRFLGVVAPDLATRLGRHRLAVYSRSKMVASRWLRVMAYDYQVRRLLVDRKYMELTRDQLARHQREKAAMARVYALYTDRKWQWSFLRPVPGLVTGAFGRRSIINGQPRSPHGGVDLRAQAGEPVRAPAAGRVALVRDTFFGGLVVLVDHGQGLISGFRHLSAVRVQPGQAVHRGQVIAAAGSTGRVTGPHLHYDVHIAGARVDPLAWQELSRRLVLGGGS